MIAWADVGLFSMALQFFSNLCLNTSENLSMLMKEALPSTICCATELRNVSARQVRDTILHAETQG